MTELVEILTDTLAAHRLIGKSNPYSAVCWCNFWAGRPDDHREHVATELEAALGIEPWTLYMASHPEVRAVYRIRALEE